jgi:hypothetical protein
MIMIAQSKPINFIHLPGLASDQVIEESVVFDSTFLFIKGKPVCQCC